MKNSTKVAWLSTGATTVAAASTASAVAGGSAATIMSATAGTTGAVWASLAGASGTAGGAAISSGMAAIGSMVGGGMAAGAVITAAAPVAAVGAIAYGLFKLLEDWWKNSRNLKFRLVFYGKFGCSSNFLFGWNPAIDGGSFKQEGHNPFYFRATRRATLYVSPCVLKHDCFGDDGLCTWCQ